MQKKLQDYFDKNPDNGVPQSAEQRAVLAMFLESQSQVDAVKTELKDPNNTKSFSDLAAELSLESKSKANKGDFGWVPQGILASTLGNTSDTVLNDTVFGKDITKDNLPALTQAEDKDQTKNIGYWLLEVTGTRTNPTPTASATPSPSPNASPVPTPTPNNTQVHLLAMLLGSKEQADQIKAKLAAGGEGNDFATLAKANFQYQNAATDGGDVGWKSKGEMSAAVDKVIFPDDPTQSIENNQVSDPIPDTTQTTKGGFWLVQVTGIETQTISSDNRTTLINNKVSDWEGKVWTDNKDKVTIQPTDAQKQFAIAQAQKR
jgi:parvulin-like peptidyl-prolyl isomerase